LDLNLFDNRKINNDFTNKFIEELKNALKNMMNEGRNMNETNNELDEYNLYEKKKVFLDNKSRSGNKLAWVMDDNSVCISEHGDGGPYFISETNLPKNVKVGEVYENIDGKYVYNSTITEEINEIEK
jgi:hypothetical protein